MNETLKAFCILDREHLLTNSEKAARALGVLDVVAANSTAQLWELANSPAVSTVTEMVALTPVIVGSEPVLEIATEDPPGGQAPGVRPTVKRTVKKGR